MPTIRCRILRGNGGHASLCPPYKCVARMSAAICGSVTSVWPACCRAHAGYLLDQRPGEGVIVDCARYATNFLYNQRRPSWRRQTCPRTSRPVMLRLGMMTRRRCQVVGLAGRRFNPNLRMSIVVIDAMLPHLVQAARRRHRPQRASRRPSSASTIVAPAATARNNTDARNFVLDPRDTRIIANRAATVVNEVRVLT